MPREQNPHGEPLAQRGWPEHRYIYSTEDGDSCSCGWEPSHFRMAEGDWDRHLDDAGVQQGRRPLTEEIRRAGDT